VIPCPFLFLQMSDPVSSSKRKRGRPAGAVQRLTVQQVAELLGVPVQTVYTWTRQRTTDDRPVLPVTRYGRAVRILITDVESLPDRLANRAPASFFVRKEAKEAA
jgi:excisionase family DNA binding protein